MEISKKRVLVIGLGQFGRTLVDSLWASGAEVVVIDKDAGAVEACKDRSSAAYVGDSAETRTLGSIGAADMDVAVVTFGEDFEATVLCAASLVKMGVKETIARAQNERQAEVLRAVGVSRVLQLEAEMGRRVAAEIAGAAADISALATGFRVMPWVARGSSVGRTLAQLELPKRFGVNVLGYFRCGTVPGKGGAAIEAPRPDYALADGDTIVVAGPTTSVDLFLAHMRG
jgi:trk system potassium uptake protein